MERLVASYKMELEYPAQILMKRSESDNLKYQISIDGADVEIQLSSYYSQRRKLSGEKFWTDTVDKVEISVSFPESEVPPIPDITPKNGHPSYYEIEQYIEKRNNKYSEIANTVIHRLIKYFKYNHNSPHLDIDSYRLSLPVWSDETGKKIWETQNRTIHVRRIPGGVSKEFSITKFERKDDKRFLAALMSETDISLYQEIMSDAQAAILQENYRRGILEMAIACEIAVTQTFFADSTISGMAYEYLDNQSRVHVKILELISNVADFVFGENFKSINESAYRNIDYLFRCRNRIAHRGQITYRDDKGIWHEPDWIIIREWWNSLEALITWLETNKRKTQKQTI